MPEVDKTVATSLPYLPEEISAVFPSAITHEFWEGCSRHELAFQQCASCGTFRHPPVPLCYVCRSTQTQWTPVAGTGSVYSYTVVPHPVHPALADRVPYNIVLVEFPDAPGVRLISNLVDVDPEDLQVGMAVRLHWEDLAEVTLPRFERA